MTRPQDAEFAAEIGADAIGLVFYDKSARAVTIAQAKSVIAALPPFVAVVALFVDAAAEYVKQCIDELQIDLLQFHGQETPDYCEQFNKPYMKAIRMQPNTKLQQLCETYESATALLLDSYKPGVPGGTGETFDWSLIEQVDKPIVLAGGLNADNVSAAIKQVKPYAVDVSGGVEQQKGIKNNEKMHKFVQEVANG
jgi:phosphoribosylanthranilate isomerase